jgi:hypothetical protein
MIVGTSIMGSNGRHSLADGHRLLILQGLKLSEVLSQVHADSGRQVGLVVQKECPSFSLSATTVFDESNVKRKLSLSWFRRVWVCLLNAQPRAENL